MVPSTLSKASLTIPITKGSIHKLCPLDERFDKSLFYQSHRESQERYIRKGVTRHRATYSGPGRGLPRYLVQCPDLPKRKISTLSEEDIDRLFNTVKSTLEEMTRRGGRDTEKDLIRRLRQVPHDPIEEHLP